jgi:hypothetical protein
MQTNYDNIPEELKALPNWVCFRYRDEDDKKPYRPGTEYAAKANKPETWGAYETAVGDTLIHGGGIGFEFLGTSYLGVDIDKCITDKDGKLSPDGEISPEAMAIIEGLDSYTEYSPSGLGLHIIIKAEGDVPIKGNQTPKKNPPQGMKKLEMYANTDPRYFTFTGNVYGGRNEIKMHSNAFISVHEKYIKKPEKTRENRVQPPARVDLSDSDLIEKIRASKRGYEFNALFDRLSGLCDDESANDLALCNMLAFWTGKDAARMDALFRQSVRYRGKWDEVHYSSGETYGEHTINVAIRDTANTYTPPGGSSGGGSGDYDEFGIRVIPMSDVVARATSFALYPYLIHNGVNIIAGESGEGKTRFALWLAATFAKGGRCILDDELAPRREPGKILYLTRENDADTDIKPLLDKMGVPEEVQERILVIEDKPDKAGGFVDITNIRLEEVIRKHNVDYCFIDPVQSYTPRKNEPERRQRRKGDYGHAQVHREKQQMHNGCAHAPPQGRQQGQQRADEGQGLRLYGLCRRRPVAAFVRARPRGHRTARHHPCKGERDEKGEVDRLRPRRGRRVPFRGIYRPERHADRRQHPAARQGFARAR